MVPHTMLFVAVATCVTSIVASKCDGKDGACQVGATQLLQMDQTNLVNENRVLGSRDDNLQNTPKYWKVANAGVTGWRPAVSEISFYSDTSCTTSIEIPTNGGWSDAQDLCSGYSYAKGCQLAFDDNTTSKWRPNCHPCGAETAWIKFKLTLKDYVKCVKAPNLGSGSASGGAVTWDGGLQVSSSLDDSAWTELARDDDSSGDDPNTFVIDQADFGEFELGDAGDSNCPEGRTLSLEDCEFFGNTYGPKSFYGWNKGTSGANTWGGLKGCTYINNDNTNGWAGTVWYNSASNDPGPTYNPVCKKESA